MKEKKNSIFYETSVFLLCFITLIVITTSIFFILGISINIFNIIIPFLITISFLYWKNKEINRVLIITIISVFILVLCILISKTTYDNTWDGASYHKQAVGLLKEGWNPVYYNSEKYNEFSGSIKDGGENPFLWAETYPKSTWYLASSIYFITNNIEAGKAYTLLFSYILFGLFYNYLSYKNIGKKNKLFICIIASLNPIVLAQFQSYYLDGAVTCILLGMLLCFIEIFDNEYKDRKEEVYFIIGLFIIWGCNLKFSVLLFTVTYCGIFYTYKCWIEKKINFKLFISLIMVGIFSILIVGYAPYVTNFVRYKDPFSLSGFTGLISSSNMEEQFGVQGLGNAGRFLVSLFGRMNHGNYETLQEVLKLPFTYKKEELQFYNYVDTRIGGFGIFFSGILLISILVIGYYGIKKENKNRAYQLTCIFTGISILEMLFLPATHTARYIGQIYGIVVFALILLSKTKKKKIINIIFMIIIFLNLLPWFKVANERVKNGIQTTATLKLLSEECEKDGKQQTIAFYAYDFNGIQYNLKDFKIDYKYIPVEEIGDNYKLTYFNWVYYK